MAYWRMKKQTEMYKKMAGQPYKEVPDTLINAEEMVNKKKREIELLKIRKASDAEVSQALAELSRLEYAYREEMKRWEANP